jgi:hypothetical protein
MHTSPFPKTLSLQAEHRFSRTTAEPSRVLLDLPVSLGGARFIRTPRNSSRGIRRSRWAIGSRGLLLLVVVLFPLTEAYAYDDALRDSGTKAIGMIIMMIVIAAIAGLLTLILNAITFVGGFFAARRDLLSGEYDAYAPSFTIGRSEGWCRGYYMRLERMRTRARHAISATAKERSRGKYTADKASEDYIAGYDLGRHGCDVLVCPSYVLVDNLRSERLRNWCSGFDDARHRR